MNDKTKHPETLYMVKVLTLALKKVKGEESFTKEEDLLYDIGCTVLGSCIHSKLYDLTLDKLHKDVANVISQSIKSVDADINIRILKHTTGE